MSPATATRTSPVETRWIVSRRFDLVWFFGGALLSLGVLALNFWVGVALPIIFWAWILLVDGPHIGAAFTRTYFDREEWRARPRVLATSLVVAFALGPTTLVASHILETKDPFLLYLGFATLYGFYHIVKQHYGFLALYKTVNREYRDFQFDKWCLYAGAWAPYLHFSLTHPISRSLLGLPRDLGTVERVLALGLVVVYFALLAAFLFRNLFHHRGKTNRPKVLYVLATLLLYGLAYYVVARHEPVWPRAETPDQKFMLITVINALWHGIQYVGLVWFHNKNRYDARAEGDFGPARSLNRSFLRYVLGLLLFSGTLYFLLAAWTGTFPTFQILTETKVGPFTANELGLCAWWGLAIHHYILDAYIWKIRGDSILKKNLGLG